MICGHGSRARPPRAVHAQRPEYLAATLAGFAGRTMAFNVNYECIAAELGRSSAARPHGGSSQQATLHQM
jgi:hypothetical protein